MYRVVLQSIHITDLESLSNWGKVTDHGTFFRATTYEPRIVASGCSDVHCMNTHCESLLVLLAVWLGPSIIARLKLLRASFFLTFIVRIPRIHNLLGGRH